MSGGKVDDRSRTVDDAITEALNRELRSWQTRGLSVHFENLHVEGGQVVGDVRLRWDETIFSHHVVLIDATEHFSFVGRKTIFSNKFSVGVGFGLHIDVDVYADVFVQDITADGHGHACVEARAKWPGGSIGTHPTCTSF